MVQQRPDRLRVLQEHSCAHRCGPQESWPGSRSPVGQLTHSDQYRRQIRQQGVRVVGRILYEYDQGGWNEWHVMMNDGTSAWLSDAQNEYALSLSSKAQNLPAAAQVHIGQQFIWNNQPYTVSVITPAHYRGVEGELPFQYWDKTDVTFVDLRSESRKFATLDYSDPEPALYLGELVEFDDLKLKNLRSFAGW